jgi:hypothetical protein
LQTDIALAKDALLDEVMCIILHIENELPCLGKSCLLEIFIRKGTSDVKVVKQLMEVTLVLTLVLTLVTHPRSNVSDLSFLFLYSILS